MLTTIKTYCEDIANDLDITPNPEDSGYDQFSPLPEALRVQCDGHPRFICVGSRPGIGKTTFALDMVLDAALSSKKDILIFSLEMSAKQITARLIRKLCGIHVGKTLKKASIHTEDKEALSKAIAVLQDLPVWIDDTPSISPTYIQTCLQTCKNPGLVMIDYMQLLHADGTFASRQHETANITRQLTDITQAFGISILCLTQLVHYQDGYPQFKNLCLPDSSLQDFDIILLLHRDPYRLDKLHEGITKIILARNRFSERGILSMRLNDHTLRFEEIHRP